MQDYASPLVCSQNSVAAGRNCWAEISLSAIGRNAHLLGSLGAEVMAVVKANAYGHGIDLVTPELVRQGIHRFGVATISEGAQVREIVGGEPDIFVMTATPPEDAPLLLEHKLTPFVSSRELLVALSEAAVAARAVASVHLEIDTGIGRAGIEPSDFEATLQYALGLPGIDVTGLCTHFTSGENVQDAQGQHHLFEQILREQVPSELLRRVVVHAANSPALLNVSGARYGMIRPGLLLYGIAPEGDEAAQIALRTGEIEFLEPALSLRARIILARELPAGAPISYGRTYQLKQAARIATIGIGYGDGYTRQFSNRGQMLLPNGAIAPVRGRVCMDQVCLELPKASRLEAGETVTIIGEAGGNCLSAAEIAGWIDATPHEITTCLTDRVPRIPV